MFDSSSKRALSSTIAVTCLPLSAARASALHDRRVAAGAVERLLDREHVGIVGGARDEIDDAVERLVRVMQQHVALRGSTRRSSSTSRSGGTASGVNGSSRRSRRSSRATICIRSATLSMPGDAVDVAIGVELQRLRRASRATRASARRPTSSRTALPRSRRRSSCWIVCEEILGLLLVDLEVEVARDAEE